jgi:hypothetical protein
MRRFKICTIYQILLVRYGGLGISVHGRDEKRMQNLTQKTKGEETIWMTE